MKSGSKKFVGSLKNSNTDVNYITHWSSLSCETIALTVNYVRLSVLKAASVF